MRNTKRHILLLCALLGFLSLPYLSKAQLSPSLYNYPNNHLPWYTLKTEHFNIHFQEGNSRTAQVTGQIAEHIYPEITSLYQFEPDTKTNIVLNDRQDYANGAAYFFDNQIEIWVPALRTPLRGTHDWLWDVISHEFTHIVQLQTAMKKDRRIPAIYFQWLSYSDVRRPDVLYGYPKGLITYPFASINMPAWLAEGVAQYQRSQMYYDYWDSHRDMLLRTAMLQGEPIDIAEMGIFGSKNALQRERVYNQGFAFTSFLVDKFGEQVLFDISNALGTPGTFSVTKALEKATGTSGQKLFNQFVAATTLEYQKAIDNLNSTNTETVEKAGFFNFYPRISTSGKNLAYLSNKKHRGATTQLFIRSLADSSSNMHALRVGRPRISGIHPATYPSSDPIIKRIQSAFSFAPSGELVAFSRKTLNGYGERYDDLFIYDLQTEETERLTRSKRLSSPAWNPRRTGIAAIQQSGGTTNLVQVDPATSVITPITNYSKGEQVYTPAWHPNGRTLFFSMSDAFTRNIYRINPRNGQPEAVLTDTLTDYRDPFVGGDGKHLYFSANPDGIFNIYRIPLRAVNPEPQQLTSVIGGAFMPHLRDGTLYFSEFKVDGYKISSISLSDVHAEQMAKTASYQQEALSAFKIPDKDDLNQRPYLHDIDPLETEKLQALSPDDSLKISFPGTPHIDSHISNHENTYTSFSFYPVIRFDNYTRKNGGNGRLFKAGKFGQLGENLLRDMKLGTYFSSREVTDQLNIFGGAMVGIASEPSDGIGDFFSPGRLTDLDRDLFLTVEHEGLPFIEKRWSPTISLELYNLRRNVGNGLSVEEFPCTSCLPDTTQSDIAYTIWEANLFLRSKINAHTMVEVGAGYSPYRVQTDGFFSQELQQFIPSSSSEYFRGTTLTAAYVYENFVPYPNSDVAPVGLSARIRYTYEPNKLLEEYEIEDGALSPVYASVKNHSLESTLRWGYPFGENSALNVYGRGFSYVNSPDDFFYLDYIGGFTGMRSYPYFAIGGNTTAMAKLSYTFPVLQSINQQVGRHTLDKLYLRMFAEAGNGWEGPLDIGQNLKTGAGAELRFAFNSYYLFPLKLFVSGSYGFNKFDVTLPQEFITDGGGSVQYGGDLLFHFGLTFDFDVLSND